MKFDEYSNIEDEIFALKQQLKRIDERLSRITKEPPAIIVKTINNKPYYYEQWREGDKVKCRSLGAVSPGCVADKEQQKLQYQELIVEKNNYEFQLSQQQRILEAYRKRLENRSMLEEYVFEVYWKNMLSSRVSVRRNKAIIKRVIMHPLRQIFPSNEISRNRLNVILEHRCFDRNRPDALEILKSIGLSEYRPIDIIRRTHGVSYNDYIWFRFMGENIRAEDVLVRDMYG